MLAPKLDKSSVLSPSLKRRARLCGLMWIVQTDSDNLASNYKFVCENLEKYSLPTDDKDLYHSLMNEIKIQTVFIALSKDKASAPSLLAELFPREAKEHHDSDEEARTFLEAFISNRKIGEKLTKQQKNWGQKHSVERLNELFSEYVSSIENGAEETFLEILNKKYTEDGKLKNVDGIIREMVCLLSWL